MENRVVILKTNRTHYDCGEAARESITVGELIDILERNFMEKDKIVFSNDNGYTYGYISEDCLQEKNL